MNKSEQKINNIPLEVRKDCTDEFMLLGILYFANKYGYKFQRMQMMKLLQKFKHRAQEDFGLEYYHKEFVKDRHGDFNSCIYVQLSNLKQADFITSVGNEPYEQFYATELGTKIFERIKMDTGLDNQKISTAKDLLEKIIQRDGRKSSLELRKENHSRTFITENGKTVKMDEILNGTVTTPNLQNGDGFIFDDRSAIDWSLYRKIAKRKREAITPDEEIPQNQEEIYKILGI